MREVHKITYMWWVLYGIYKHTLHNYIHTDISITLLQLKDMISQLYQSWSAGTRKFTCGGVSFGGKLWKTCTGGNWEE